MIVHYHTHTLMLLFVIIISIVFILVIIKQHTQAGPPGIPERDSREFPGISDFQLFLIFGSII